MAKETKTETVGIRLTAETRNYLVSEAEADERSLSFVAGKILTNYVKEKNLRQALNNVHADKEVDHLY